MYLGRATKSMFIEHTETIAYGFNSGNVEYLMAYTDI